MDSDVFKVVSGGYSLKGAIKARLIGYQTYYWPGEDFPYITKCLSSTTNGLLINIRSKKILDRIKFFEESDYLLREVEIELIGDSIKGKAMSFFPTSKLTCDALPVLWTLSDWKKNKKKYLEMTEKLFLKYLKPM